MQTSWSVATHGNQMTITITNKETDYDAGNAVYVGYELDGATYTVTSGGEDTETFTYSGCY